MSQTQRLGTTATTVTSNGEYTVVTYHNTAVIKWNQREIVLNNGGWQTATTKLRINQASNQFQLGISVIQRDFSWYAVTKAGEFEFVNGMKIDRITGELIAEYENA